MRKQKNYHPKKFLDDGILNPKWKPRASGKSGKRTKRGKKLSKFNRGDFVSWDGEGITLDNGKHVYALLANSRDEYIMNPQGLGTYECLDFLCNQAEKYKNSIHAGFVFSYDTAMMLFADMDYDTVKRIWENTDIHGTWWGEFKISYQPRKCLRISRIGDPTFTLVKVKGEWKYKLNVLQSVVLWDVFGFFQSSFVEAIEKWLGKDYELLDMIKSGKLHRGSFTEEMLEKEVLPYCLAEVHTCDKLLALLLQYLKDADIQISRWDGAGAIAAAMLKKNGIKNHMAELPDEVQEGAEHAYFGGRIELCKYGHYVGTVYHYDINSAYPSAQTECPSLTNGHWERVVFTHPDTLYNVSHFSLFRVRWKLSSDEIEQSADWSLYPFPYREISGQVIFPYEGEGWYWYPEVNAGLHALTKFRARYPGAYIEILDGFQFVERREGCRPFTFLREKYDQRKRWKAAHISAEKVLKLGVNSTYGKTAQHSGYNPETKRKPPYHNLAWAGYITSKTRSMLFSAAMQKPEACLMLATDGIFSIAPLDLPCSNDLGEWEYETHDEIIIVQSGVYFHRTGQVWSTFCRGFDKGTLTHEKILRAWKKSKTVAYFPSTRFQGIGTSVTSEKSWQNRGQWIGVGEEKYKEGKQPEPGRSLSLWTENTKRAERTTSHMRPLWTEKKQVTPADTLINTFASFNYAEGMISKRYALPWELDTPIEGFIDGVEATVVEREHLDSEME